MIRRSVSITTEKAIEMYLTEKQALGSTEKTLSDYRLELNNFFRDVKLSEVNSQFFYSKINEMLKTKKAVTVNHYIRCSRAFLYWCMQNDYIAQFKITLVKAQEAPLKLYSINDITKLLEKPTHKYSFPEWRTWAMVSFVMGTGARAGTLSEIRLSDLDLNSQEVVYRHSKNKKAPVVPICNELKAALLLYMKEFELTDYLFPAQNGNKLTDHGISEAFEKYCKLKNVQYQSFHALRHTYAKQFIVNGGNPFQLQRMLDHQTLTMSQHYTHLFGSDLHDVVNDFSPLSKLAVRNNKPVRK